MLAQEFIKNNLHKLSASFPDTCFKYGFDEEIKTHVIEITPQEHFYNLDALDEAWIPVSISFMELFPKEEIVFISSDSSLAMDKYSFACNQQKESKLFSELFESLLNSAVNISFVDSLIMSEEPQSNNTGECISFINPDPTNITNKPFESNLITYDADQFLMAA